MLRALLFDLDETLVVEEPAAVAAFEATAAFAASRCDLEAAELAVTARRRARQLWSASPTHPYCRRVGISSWEGLWCRFEGAGSDLSALRDWAPAYRREAWRLALADQGIDDAGLAADLGERFGVERRGRHETFADCAGTIAGLAGRYELALVTNGASCLQREKLAASGLAEHFPVVVVSGEFGVGKPDAGIFRHALELLGTGPEHAVMIGDSLERDLTGALAAGLKAIWVNRSGHPRQKDLPDVPEIASLDELPAVLSELA